MEFRIFAGITLVVCVVFVVRKITKSRRLGQTALISALSGVVSLTAVNALAAFTYVSIDVNWVSGVFAAVLGVPGVVGMLALKLLAGLAPL